MMTQTERNVPTPKPTSRIYAPELLAQMQDLLSELADLDCAFENDMEIVRKDSCSEPAKLALIKELQQKHDAQCAPIVTELAALEAKISQDLRF